MLFGATPDESFTVYGLSHLIMLLIFIAGLVFLFLSYKTIRNNHAAYNSIRWGLFSLLVLSELGYQAWAALNGIWSANAHLPMHLCGIAGIIAAIALVTLDKRYVIIAYFIGFIPPILALVTPELHYGFPHFRYWKFFIHHFAISWASIFLVLTSGVKISFHSMFKTYGLLLLYAALMGFIVNPLIDANFLYLAHTPDASTPLDFLGNGFWYYMNLCLLGIVVFSLLVGLARVFRSDLELDKKSAEERFRYLS